MVDAGESTLMENRALHRRLQALWPNTPRALRVRLQTWSVGVDNTTKEILVLHLTNDVLPVVRVLEGNASVTAEEVGCKKQFG